MFYIYIDWSNSIDSDHVLRSELKIYVFPF